MMFVDIALRGSTIGLPVLLAGLMSRAPIGWEGRISIIAVAVSKSAFLLVSTAVPLDFPPLLNANLILFASLTPNAITWLIVTIFLDPPGRRWPWLVASSLVSVLLYLSHTAPDLELLLPCASAAVVLYAALFGLALWTSRDDLVECRCRARPGFAAAIAGLGLVLTEVQATGLLEAGTPGMALLQSAGTFAVTFAFAIWLLTPDVDLWPGTHEHPLPHPKKPASEAPDRALIARIRTAMADGIWREEGLTIGALAARLDVPEHRLLRAINGGLGHRNFSSFINRARIAQAQAELADPDGARTTVLEIAYGVGFASLGPFTRAFRAETGQSPTEFRRTALEEAGDDTGDRTLRADFEEYAPIPANLH